MKVWIIEDDKTLARTYADTLKNHFKGVLVRVFDFPADVVDVKTKKNPDFIFYDMTRGLIPMGFDLDHLVHADIGAIYERYPSTIIAIYSAMDEWAKDVVDEIIEEWKDKKIFLVHASFRPKGWIRIIEAALEGRE